jgi:oligopeptide transport system substrate-binding protein
MSARHLLLTFAALALLASCKKERIHESGPAEKMLRIAYFEPQSFDPALLHGGPGKDLAENLFEGLCSHAADGSIIAGQAYKWLLSDDAKTWTFELREGLTWSDGKALSAQDFVWSLRRAINPSTGNPQANELWPIKNARAITKGTIKDLSQLGVRAKGTHTVVIVTENPFPFLPNLMAAGYTLPVPRHVVEKHGKKWTVPGNLVTNGAYTIASHKHDQEMLLSANPRYWAAKTVKTRTIKYRYTSKAELAYQWYRLGEIDWSMGLVPQESAGLLRKNRDPALRIDEYDGLFYLLLNTKKAPFDNRSVRRAFDLAIDRARMTRQVTSQGERPANTFIPVGMTASRPPNRVRFDPQEARKLLAEAGYGPQNPFPQVEILFNTHSKNQRIAAFIQRNLKENLGVNLVLHNVEWKTFLERLDKREFHLCHLVLGGGFNPIGYLEMLESNSPTNYSEWSNSDFDAAIGQARLAPSKKELETAITRAMAIADLEVPILSMYRLTRLHLIRPELSGYQPNAENRHLLRWVAWGKQ